MMDMGLDTGQAIVAEALHALDWMVASTPNPRWM
jgi:hypothetical protein